MNSSKKNILVILPTLNECGGIETFFMSYYRYMRNKYNFIVLTHENNSEKYKKIILDSGDKLIVMPKFCVRNYNLIRKKYNTILEKERIDVVHCQMANAAFLYLALAKKHGINTRILHSHQCKYADKMTHAIRNMPLIRLGLKKANVLLACGKDAGKFMYKNKHFTTINNAVDIDLFKFNQETRRIIRNKYHIRNDEIFVGNIGRLAPQKNQKFIIDLAEKTKNDNIKYIIIGNGDLERELGDMILAKGLADKIIIEKPTSQVKQYYDALDVFVLPSIYEGLPYVLVEAQANGLPTLISNKVTEESIMSKNSILLPISNDSLNAWVKAIKAHKRISDVCIPDKFNLQKQISILEQVYECA